MKLAALALVTVLAVPATAHADTALPLHRGDTGAKVTAVQQRLVDYGYVLAVDGRYGPRTIKAVQHWQRANRLTIDGVVGAQTLESLGLAASVTAPARRLDPPPPQTFTDNCAEMHAYRVAAGLPDQFDAIGYRESRCRNDVSSWCCHGWFQNFLSSHLSRQSAYRERIIGECGVTTVADIKGLSEAQKRAQACVTFVVWSISGMSPWRLG